MLVVFMMIIDCKHILLVTMYIYATSSPFGRDLLERFGNERTDEETDGRTRLLTTFCGIPVGIVCFDITYMQASVHRQLGFRPY